MKMSPQISEKLYGWLSQDEVTNLEALEFHILAQLVFGDEWIARVCPLPGVPVPAPQVSIGEIFVVSVNHVRDL